MLLVRPTITSESKKAAISVCGSRLFALWKDFLEPVGGIRYPLEGRVIYPMASASSHSSRVISKRLRMLLARNAGIVGLLP